ncbi:hypothetical protein GUJ93_ZPchr0001g30565 [Zizania palustris]|uniref:Uncharacterized protein n=1 Tax=Zizania palustris TaxID=103762 RepID=A0A8J5RFU9_ZIZPA|nr:hypothetical protein GUJ93_ZPchr0001g30565 [Zizania palustris]
MMEMLLAQRIGRRCKGRYGKATNSRGTVERRKEEGSPWEEERARGGAPLLDKEGDRQRARTGHGEGGAAHRCGKRELSTGGKSSMRTAAAPPLLPPLMLTAYSLHRNDAAHQKDTQTIRNRSRPTGHRPNGERHNNGHIGDNVDALYLSDDMREPSSRV